MFMNRYVNIGLAFGMSAFLGAAVHVSAQAKPETAKPATQKPQTAKPATEAGTAVSLGAVRLPRAVRAGGENLPAGTYQLRVTETPATPQAAGQTPQYERWAEFMRDGKVVAREVVTIVPGSDIKEVAEQTPPPSGGYRAELLKGNDYLRLWVNRGGNHYLMHFNTEPTK
jgi:hypothetical protein